MGLGHSVLWEDTRGQDLWHLPHPWKSPGGRLMLWDSGKLGLGQRSRMTHKESRGKAYVEGQQEAGTWVYRLRKEAWSRMTKESRGKAYIVGQWEAGTRCIDLGQTVLWEDTGQATSRWFWGMFLRNWRIYDTRIYSAELVLSTELSQAVTKELVTNRLTFNLWIPVTGPR